MDRIHHATTSASPPPVDAYATPGYPTEGNPLGGVEATVFTAWMGHSLIEEIRNALLASGITPAKATLTQLAQTIRRMAGANVAVHTVGAVLTADDAGLHVINIDANRIYQLPLADSAGGRPLRFTFVRLDQSAFNATITLGAGDDIDGLTTMQVPIGGRVELIGDGSATWHVMGGIGRRMEAFDASDTFTVPAGVFRIRCRLWGGGGGGGGVGSGGGGAAGGGGGGYAEGYFDVTPGQVLPITIGAGGAPGNGTPTNGGNGGTSSIGTLLSATGGGGGQGVSGGATAPVNGTAGNGTGGQYNHSGYPANAGVDIGGATLGSAGGGTYGAGFIGGYSLGTGNSAASPGGGGGGAGGAVAQNGAAGSAGLAIIEWGF